MFCYSATPSDSPPIDVQQAGELGLTKAALLKRYAARRAESTEPAANRAKSSEPAVPGISSAFRYVTKDRKGWRAQCDSSTYIGHFQSEAEAADAVADHLGIQKSSLKRKRSTVVSMDSQVERFKALMQVYTDSSGKCIVMSDLTSSVDAMTRWPLLSVCAPGLHFASLMGKVGPWKSHIGCAWQVAARSIVTDSSASSRWSVESVLSGVTLRSLQLVEVLLIKCVGIARCMYV